mmetsp:Transcript_21632/g.45183  ORF Transcript_21632/g.45183 Transcript_21632/m.45183 type:complete len:209 (+) Transcript_21632:709-1335(+)
MATSYLQYSTPIQQAVDMPPLYRGPCSLVLPAVVLCYAATATCKGTWPGNVLRRGLPAAASACSILDGHLFRSELQLRALGAPVRPCKLGKNSKLCLVGFDEGPDGRGDGWLKALAAAAHIGVQYPPRRRRRVLVHFKQHIILAVAVRRHVRVLERALAWPNVLDLAPPLQRELKIEEVLLFVAHGRHLRVPCQVLQRVHLDRAHALR